MVAGATPKAAVIYVAHNRIVTNLSLDRLEAGRNPDSQNQGAKGTTLRDTLRGKDFGMNRSLT